MADILLDKPDRNEQEGAASQESKSHDPLSSDLLDAVYFEGAVNDAVGTALVHYGSEHRLDAPGEQGAPTSLAYGFDGALDFSFSYETEE